MTGGKEEERKDIWVSDAQKKRKKTCLMKGEVKTKQTTGPRAE